MDIINPLEYPKWDELLLASNDHSFFHTSFWAHVLHDSYGYRPCYLARVHDGKLAALLPLMEVKSFLTGRKGVSLPFTDYCEPIVSGHDSWRDVLDFLKSYGGKHQWKHWELRGGEQWMEQAPYSSFYYRHVLELSADADALHAQLKSSTKRNIKKASREGVAVTRSSSLEAVKTFYRLHCLTRRKHGLPPQPFYFFQRLYDHAISNDHGQVVLAAYQGKAIAGAIYLHFGNEAVYKFGASHGAYLHLRPNDLVMWEAIRWYRDKGYASFNFGRTEPENEGLLRFKRGWGAREYPTYYYKYDLRQNAFVQDRLKLTGIHNRIFKTMPMPLLKLAGMMLYRHVG